MTLQQKCIQSRAMVLLSFLNVFFLRRILKRSGQNMKSFFTHSINVVRQQTSQLKRGTRHLSNQPHSHYAAIFNPNHHPRRKYYFVYFTDKGMEIKLHQDHTAGKQQNQNPNLYHATSPPIWRYLDKGFSTKYSTNVSSSEWS